MRRIHDELNFYEAFLRPAGRRARRTAYLADLACERMKEEKFDRAARLFERSLEMEPGRDEIRALYATALEFCGRHRRPARRCAGRPKRKPPCARCALPRSFTT